MLRSTCNARATAMQCLGPYRSGTPSGSEWSLSTRTIRYRGGELLCPSSRALNEVGRVSSRSKRSMAAAQPRSAVLAALHEDHRQLEVLSSRAAAAEEAVSHLDAADGKKVWTNGDSDIREPYSWHASMLANRRQPSFQRWNQGFSTTRTR